MQILPKFISEIILGNGLFKDERVKKAMLAVDRGDFAPTDPYGDHPVSIGYGATISAPHMVLLSIHCRNLNLYRKPSATCFYLNRLEPSSTSFFLIYTHYKLSACDFSGTVKRSSERRRQSAGCRIGFRIPYRLHGVNGAFS